MRRFILIFLLSIVFCITKVYADSEVQDLTDIVSPVVGDDLYIVDDPDGTPASRKISIGALLAVAADLDSSGQVANDSHNHSTSTLTNIDQELLTTSAVTFGTLDVSGQIQAGSGNHDLTNAAGLIDGEKIQDNSIDDDSIDFNDVTGIDLTLTDCTDITATATRIWANSAYVQVSTASDSSQHMYFAGVFATLPSSGWDANTVCVYTGGGSSILYISTESVIATNSWQKVGAQ